MTKRREILVVLAALVLTVATHACAPTHTCGLGANGSTLKSPVQAPPGLDRVRTGLRDAFLRDPPSCVILLPAEAAERGALNPRLVEAGVERFLAIRFDRVIAGARRDGSVRHLALDLRRPRDLAVLARHENCGHALSVRIGGGGLSYAVVWAERRLTLFLSLRRIGGKADVLWSAKGVGARGDGGIPISPLGLASALYRAGRMAEDRDQAPSLLDDLLRRVMASLPDVRGLAYSAPRAPLQAGRFSMNSTVMPSGSRR
jgi:hypothetical protein